jgi:peptide/nickel transport system permease protein
MTIMAGAADAGGLGRYLGGRLVRALVTIFGVVNLAFVLIRVVPGDPADVILGDTVSPEEKQAWRESHGLDRPLVDQWLGFLGDVADGSLGETWVGGGTVADEIADVLPATAALAVAALVVAWALALPLGIVAASRRRTAWDDSARTFAVIGLAIPNIWLGPLLILLFGVELRWLPLPGDDATGLTGLVLPAFTIGTALAAILTRQTRGSMTEVLQEQYVLAARARGLSSSSVLVRHALRNALMPVLTVGGAQLGALLAGTVVAEKIFERPGLGSLLLEGFFQRDLPVVQGCALVMGFVYVTVNLLVDLLYGAIDPRVRLS